MKIRLRYFAQLKDEAGKDQEILETTALTPRQVYEEISAVYRFSLGVDLVKPAVNDEFSSWDETLSEGDLLVFVPPVAGG